MDSAGQVTIGTSLAADTYRVRPPQSAGGHARSDLTVLRVSCHLCASTQVCYADAASSGDADTDFLVQVITFTIATPAVSSISAANAAPMPWTSNTDVVMAVVGPVQGDFIAILDSSTVGCLGANTVKLELQVGVAANSGTGLAAGSYKVCFALDASGGNDDEDYVDVGLSVTVVAATITAAPLTWTAGVDIQVDLTGSAVGDFVKLVPTTSAGCLGAGGSALVVSAGPIITTGTALTATTYRLCHAPAASSGDADGDFTDQGVAVTVTAPYITGAAPISASAAHIVAGVDAEIQLTEGTNSVGTNDFVAFISTSSIGCVGAAATKRTVLSGDKVTTGTSLVADTYKLCFAIDTTVGDADSDFIEQPATITVVGTILASLTSPNAMPAAVTETTDVSITVGGGSIADGDFIALIPSTATGCHEAHNTPARIFTVASGAISLGTGVTEDGWKVCTAAAASLGNEQADYVESAVTFTTLNAELTGMVVLESKPSTLAAGVSVKVDITGETVMGDYVAFVLQSSVGCLGAGGTGFVVGSNNEVAVSVPIAGTYRTCYATAASGGDADADYRDAGAATVTGVARSVTAISVSGFAGCGVSDGVTN